MKKSFYTPSKRKKKNTWLSKTSWGVLFFILFFILLQIVVPNATQGTMRGVAYPFWKSGMYIGNAFNSFSSFFKNDDALRHENELLKEELRNSRTLALRNRALEEENAGLLKILGRQYFKSTVLAPILRRPPSTPYDILLLDISEHSDVQVGNRIVVDGRIVVGHVSSLDGNIGVATLFSTSGIETEVFISTTTAGVMAKGRGNGNFSAEVPKDFGVQKGDMVTLTGGPLLVLGEVLEIESNSADPFDLVLFRTPFSLNSLRWVQIVTNNEEEAKSMSLEEDVEKQATTSDQNTSTEEDL